MVAAGPSSATVVAVSVLVGNILCIAIVVGIVLVVRHRRKLSQKSTDKAGLYKKGSSNPGFTTDGAASLPRSNVDRFYNDDSLESISDISEVR